MKKRCQWVEAAGDFYIRYHDEEWGVPVYDDVRLFEAIVLDGFQAGLSWATILKKRENFRLAFDGFDPVKIAGYGQRKILQLLDDAGIIRNRLKIESAVKNAEACLRVRNELGSFSDYLWGFVGGQPIVNAWKKDSEIPTRSPEAEAMSRDLKKRGFSFVGPTIIYAFMQAVGMVNDHTVDCYRYRELLESGK